MREDKCADEYFLLEAVGGRSGVLKSRGSRNEAGLAGVGLLDAVC